MTHYYMSSSDPTAIITSRNSERKLYQGNTIYLNDGDNFEIRLFNPLREKIGVEIRFNGQKKSQQLLVLNPGQDYILDRFIEEQRKMVFDTYLINGDNAAAVSAAAENGKIEVFFYKEKYIYHNGGLAHFTNINSGTSGYSGIRGASGTSAIGGTSGTGQYQRPGIYFNEVDNSITPTSSLDINVNLTLNDSIDYSEYLAKDQQVDYEAHTRVITGSITNTSGWVDGNSNTVKLRSKSLSKNLVETGRIEKGDVSNQNFQEVEVEFETYAFHSVYYFLKPATLKTRNTKEIRFHCPTCGAKIKDKYNFCTVCGLDLRKI